LTALILGSLGKIYLSQARLNDTDVITRAAIRILKESGVPPNSHRMGSAMMPLGAISVARRNFTEAMQHYDSAKQALLDNQYYYENVFARNPNVIISLLKTGRTEEAMKLISKFHGRYNILERNIIGPCRC